MPTEQKAGGMRIRAHSLLSESPHRKLDSWCLQSQNHQQTFPPSQPLQPRGGQKDGELGDGCKAQVYEVYNCCSRKKENEWHLLPFILLDLKH